MTAALQLSDLVVDEADLVDSDFVVEAVIGHYDLIEVSVRVPVVLLERLKSRVLVKVRAKF